MPDVQMPQPSNTPMSSAFRNTPINPYQQRAEDLRAQLQAEQQTQGQSVPDNKVYPATPQPVSQPIPEPQPQPVPQPQPQPTTPQQSPVDPALVQQLMAEREMLHQTLMQQRQQLDELSATAREYNALKQRAELQQSLTDEAFGELSTVDAEDARQISSAILNATQTALDPIYNELAELRKLQSQSNGQQQQQFALARTEQLRNKVLEAHPDFLQLQQDPAYHAFMSQRDGLSSQTRDQRAAQEFRAGNTEYVIDMLRQYKAGNPNVAHIQSVAPVQAAAAAPATTAPAPTRTLRELNTLYQMGQISREDYIREAKEAKEAFYRESAL